MFDIQIIRNNTIDLLKILKPDHRNENKILELHTYTFTFSKPPTTRTNLVLNNT